MLGIAESSLRDKKTVPQRSPKDHSKQELTSVPAPAPATAQPTPVSLPKNLVLSVEKTTTVFQSSACIYKKVSSAVFNCPESLNLTLGSMLGRGAYAEVKGVYCHSRKRLMALKVVDKTAASMRSLSKHIPREIKLLRMLSHLHPHIISAQCIVETEHRVFILMNLAENGDLAHYIGSRVLLPEPEACCLFREMADGMQFLHFKHIAHRDLKCANILLDRTMSIKIADFGYGIDVSAAIARSACGTYAYAAPELFSGIPFSYDALKADVWSMGVVLFAMATGQLVFGDNNTAKTNRDRQVHFPPDISLSEPLKDLILCMLRIDAASRLTSSQVCGHAWIHGGTPVRPPQPSCSKYTKGSLDIQVECCDKHHPLDLLTNSV